MVDEAVKFIRQLLKSEKLELLEKIEDLEKEVWKLKGVDLSEVLAIIRGLKKEIRNGQD